MRREESRETKAKMADFQAKQKMGYEFKKAYAARRAWEFYKHPEVAGRCFVSMGGLDSITLYVFLRSIGIDVPAVSVSHLEHKSIQKVHKAMGVRPLKAALDPLGRPYTKVEIIREFGFPVISKESADKIDAIQRPTPKNAKYRHTIITGETEDEHGKIVISSMKRLGKKWVKLFGGLENERECINCQVAPFRVSDKCCYYLKEKPCSDYAKESGLYPYMGLMASEGGRREKALMLRGCNYISPKTKRSCPFAIFNRQDILTMALEMDAYYQEHWMEFWTRSIDPETGAEIFLPPTEPLESIVPEIYGEIVRDENGALRTTKAERTGCEMCGFGIHKEHRPHRFDRIRRQNPKEWEMWMSHICQDADGEWYGWGRVLTYIGVGWKDDLFDAEDPKHLCDECARELKRDYNIRPPDDVMLAIQTEKGTCWSCGRKRKVSLYFAVEEEQET